MNTLEKIENELWSGLKKNLGITPNNINKAIRHAETYLIKISELKETYSIDEKDIEDEISKLSAKQNELQSVIKKCDQIWDRGSDFIDELHHLNQIGVSVSEE